MSPGSFASGDKMDTLAVSNAANAAVLNFQLLAKKAMTYK